MVISSKLGLVLEEPQPCDPGLGMICFLGFPAAFERLLCPLNLSRQQTTYCSSLSHVCPDDRR